MKKIELSKETLRALTAQEADAVAGGVTSPVLSPSGACDKHGAGVEAVTRTPCQTFPVNVCVTGRC